MAKCRGCGAEIFFIPMKTGYRKFMPVNASPVYVEDKNGPEIIITEDGRVSNGRQEIVKSENKLLTKGYISHFATCPKSALFRNRQNRN